MILQSDAHPDWWIVSFILTRLASRPLVSQLSVTVGPARVNAPVVHQEQRVLPAARHLFQSSAIEHAAAPRLKHGGFGDGEAELTQSRTAPAQHRRSHTHTHKHREMGRKDKQERRRAVEPQATWPGFLLFDWMTSLEQK